MFEVLGRVVVVVWVVLAAFLLVGSIVGGLTNDQFFAGLLGGILAAALAVVYGIISWASVTLLSLVARYIANRS